MQAVPILMRQGKKWTKEELSADTIEEGELKIVVIWIDNFSHIEGDDLYEKVNSADITGISTGCKLFIFWRSGKRAKRARLGMPVQL